MSRPGVSVVMPFAGSAAEAADALRTLAALDVGPEDELILVDNSGSAPEWDGVRVVRARAEQSPSYARNAGAARAHRDWILFLDSDCRAPADVLARFFAEPVEEETGALAGAVLPAPAATSLAARYGAAKSFLAQDVHLAHGFMPRAVAANLLVRRAAFEEVGGFYEGVRAAEDTDFSWRLQRAGWRLGYRPAAQVEHSYRTTVRALRRQWRGYAAGRAWLARRYDGFEPEPALRRAGGRALRRRRPAPASASTEVASTQSAAVAAVVPASSRLDRGSFLVLDAVLGLEELAGFALSNRPRRPARVWRARVVLVADRFPAQGDPLADFALTLAGARVEAAGRPESLAPRVARALTIDYREDDGAAARLSALLRLVVRHPLRSARDLIGRSGPAPGLAAIAPAAVRLRRDPEARVHPLGGGAARGVAVRLARLAGRRLEG